MNKAELWFLTGSQHLYGPETLAQVADQSQQIQRALSDSGVISATLVWKPVLTDAAAIRAVMQEANADPSCIHSSRAPPSSGRPQPCRRTRVPTGTASGPSSHTSCPGWDAGNPQSIPRATTKRT